jgi:hypothetical protein
LGARQAADNVVVHAQHQAGVVDVRVKGADFLHVLIGLFAGAQALDVVGFDAGEIVGHVAARQSQGEEPVDIVGAALQATLGALLGLLQGGVKVLVQFRVGRNALVAQELVAGDEKLALQRPLAGQDFVQNRRAPEGADGGAFRLGVGYLLEEMNGLSEFQVVEMVEGGAELVLTGRRNGGGGRGPQGGLWGCLVAGRTHSAPGHHSQSQ